MAEQQPDQPARSSAGLARNISLFALIVYGVGDMVGSGIYGMIGKAAGMMGNTLWLAFVVSLTAAMLTGLSYAALASRYPRAAGAAFVTHQAFSLKFLTYVVGLTVTASGLVSMATATNVFSENLSAMSGVPMTVLIVGFLTLLMLINLYGIRESLWMNFICTLIEVGGLVFIIIVGLRFWGSVDYLETPAASTGMGGLSATMVLSGAVLTFYAFIGFEDMINVAEEVKNPRRNMPIGIISALVIVTVLYILVSITAVSVVNWKELGDASRGAPLQQITNVAAPWLPGWVFAVITLFAVANTALINYIMGSRLVYGMARHGLLPPFLGRVHARRKTPWASIIILFVIVVALAMVRDVKQLADATSMLLLTSFMVVNAAMIVLKFRDKAPPGTFDIPVIVPMLGVLVCLAMVVSRLIEVLNAGYIAPLLALGLIAFISVLYFIMKPGNVIEYSEEAE